MSTAAAFEKRPSAALAGTSATGFSRAGDRSPDGVERRRQRIVEPRRPSPVDLEFVACGGDDRGCDDKRFRPEAPGPEPSRGAEAQQPGGTPVDQGEGMRFRPRRRGVTA